jgi:hypothetical protein
MEEETIKKDHARFTQLHEDEWIFPSVKFCEDKRKTNLDI